MIRRLELAQLCLHVHQSYLDIAFPVCRHIILGFANLNLQRISSKLSVRHLCLC